MAELKKTWDYDLFEGYTMLRDAQLTEKAWDTLETWTEGDYTYSKIAAALRKLERPIPGRPGHTQMLGIHFQDSQQAVGDSANYFDAD